MFDSTPDLNGDLTAILARTRVTVVPHPETTTVMHLAGPLDRGSAPQALDEITTAIAAGHPNLILDVRDVPSIDGAGAKSLLVGMHQAQRAGGDLHLVAPTDLVIQRLELAGLAEMLPIDATVVEALEALEVAAAVDAPSANECERRVPPAPAHDHVHDVVA
jgi:anti-sigma B factor antagonist